MLKTAHIGAAAILASALSLPAMAADATPPQIDTTRPHDQIYPQTAQVGGEQGDIFLKVFVHANGKADRVLVAKSSGYSDLDNAAVQSALNWHYLPATANGDTVSDWMVVHVVYQLPQGAGTAQK